MLCYAKAGFGRGDLTDLFLPGFFQWHYNQTVQAQAVCNLLESLRRFARASTRLQKRHEFSREMARARLLAKRALCGTVVAGVEERD